MTYGHTWQDQLPTEKSDVVVVGGGMAGWTAARRAQQLGLEVTLLEKGPAPPGSCNARMSGGMLHASYVNLNGDPEYLEEYLLAVTDGRARPELAHVWARNCARAVQWLVEQGAELLAPDLSPAGLSYLAPLMQSPVGLASFERDRGPDRALTALADAFTEGGGAFRPSTRAKELVVDASGAVSGVVAQADSGLTFYESRAVLIADGGFQANKELLVRYIGPHADEMLLRAMPTATGDGLRMGLAIGAKAVNMNYFYGHIVSADAIDNPKLWPYPVLDSLLWNGILVNQRGERWVNEAIAGVDVTRRELSGIGLTNALGKSDGPREGIAIFTHRTWLDAQDGYLGTLPPNPYLVEQGARVYSAPDIGALAREAGIPADALCRTVESFNSACTSDSASDLPVPRSGSPAPLSDGPFYAVPCAAAITFTMGGLLVSPRGEVLDLDERPIPGLYAAGGAMGGLQGGPRGGYAGGLSEALVFGLLSAEGLAEAIQGSPASSAPQDRPAAREPAALD